ncbi:MAG: phosphotransferase [Planctomycetota bacterium]
MTRPALDQRAAPTLDTQRWIEHTLRADVRAFHTLAGGRNNRAFRVDLPDGPPALLKAYFRSDADPRDRLHHEWAFSEFAWKQGVRRVPEPIARNLTLNAALYGFVPGRMLRPEEATGRHVRQATEFFRELNGDPTSPDALALPPGSEACFTNIDHVALVDQRVRRLDEIAEPNAAAFLERELKPYWASVHPPIAKAKDAFEPTPVCVSPSDFGFHNAILRDDDGTLVFHDFEYAGQDDPAKLLGDFFHQPRVPAPGEAYPAFEDAVIETLGLDDAQRERFRTLLPVYRVKWCGIVLSPLLPEAAERRKFAGIETDPREIVERATRLLHRSSATTH